MILHWFQQNPGWGFLLVVVFVLFVAKIITGAEFFDCGDDEEDLDDSDRGGY